MLDEAVFALCAVTSVAAAWLLLRGWLASRTSLLLWSSLGFLLLAANNIVLFIDEVVVAGIDFGLLRNITGLAGLVVLLYGLMEERA